MICNKINQLGWLEGNTALDLDRCWCLRQWLLEAEGQELCAELRVANLTRRTGQIYILLRNIIEYRPISSKVAKKTGKVKVLA